MGDEYKIILVTKGCHNSTLSKRKTTAWIMWVVSPSYRNHVGAPLSGRKTCLPAAKPKGTWLARCMVLCFDVCLCVRLTGGKSRERSDGFCTFCPRLVFFQPQWQKVPARDSESPEGNRPCLAVFCQTGERPKAGTFHAQKIVVLRCTSRQRIQIPNLLPIKKRLMFD